MTIGEKRNYGCERAAGVIIVHWDDDDYSAPGRIADQVDRLSESGLSVTGYNRMSFRDGTRRWLFTGAADFALGTSLCYRKEFWAANRFPGLQIGEDYAFLSAARRLHQIVSVEAGEMMYATVHPGNTSPRQLIGREWKEL